MKIESKKKNESKLLHRARIFYFVHCLAGILYGIYSCSVADSILSMIYLFSVVLRKFHAYNHIFIFIFSVSLWRKHKESDRVREEREGESMKGKPQSRQAFWQYFRSRSLNVLMISTIRSHIAHNFQTGQKLIIQSYFV